MWRRSRAEQCVIAGATRSAELFILCVVLLLALPGCEHRSRGLAQIATEKPCGEAALATQSIGGMLAVGVVCNLAAIAVDDAMQPSEQYDAFTTRECPPLKDKALVPLAVGRPLAFKVDVGTVVPGAVRSNVMNSHPSDCWLRTGIDAEVLRSALVTSLLPTRPESAETAEPYVLGAAVLGQEENEDFHGTGDVTRRVRIEIRYTLSRPPSGEEVWSELIATEISLSYGILAKHPSKAAQQGAGPGGISSAAYALAIRENIFTVVKRLQDVKLSE